jgi:hypothetical protein
MHAESGGSSVQDGGATARGAARQSGAVLAGQSPGTTRWERTHEVLDMFGMARSKTFKVIGAGRTS